MAMIQLIVIFIVCALSSLWLYRVWRTENDSYEISNEYDYCVKRGDMYCNHTDWCDAEIALYPEQYELEMKRLANTEDK